MDTNPVFFILCVILIAWSICLLVLRIRDSWQIGKRGKCHISNAFYETQFQFGFPSFDPDNDYMKLDIPQQNSIPVIQNHDHHIRTLLLDNRLYLRTSHYDNDGFMGVYMAKLALCARCVKKLGCHAFFLGYHYYCFECIKSYIIPTYLYDRIALYNEVFGPDIAGVISKFTVFHCFDIHQIMRYQYLCGVDQSRRLCTIFNCTKAPMRDFQRSDLVKYLVAHKPSHLRLLGNNIDYTKNTSLKRYLLERINRVLNGGNDKFIQRI